MTDQDIMNLRERVREHLDALEETLKLKKQHAALSALRDGLNEYDAGWVSFLEESLAGRPLRDLLEADAGAPLPLVSEEEQNTYSDVSLLLCAYLGVSASYAKKHFGLEYDARGREVASRRFGYGRRA